MKSITVTTKFHEFSGWETGNSEGFTILSFHGWLDNANSFLRLAPLFPEYRWISLDWSGHGNSTKKPDRTLYHFAEGCLDLVSIAQSLKLEKFHLVAHSMGAAISTLVAGLGLLPIQKLVLIEALGPISLSAKKTPDQMKESIEQILHPKGRQETLFPDMNSAIRVRMRAGDMSEASVKILLDRGLEVIENGLRPKRDLRLHYHSFSRLTEEQVISFCERIVAPTLLILGNQSIFPIQNQFDGRKKAIKTFKEIVLPGGHHLHLDTPEPVAKIIRNFFNE